MLIVTVELTFSAQEHIIDYITNITRRPQTGRKLYSKWILKFRELVWRSR